jgi:site-specific DNA recombinase
VDVNRGQKPTVRFSELSLEESATLSIISLTGLRPFFGPTRKGGEPHSPPQVKDDDKTVTMKRAVLYARVSTDDQADKGYSLPSQLEACRKYAESCGFVIIGEFQEDYTGAVPIELRPEGSKAHALLKEDRADAIVVFSVDRLVRPPNDGDEWDMPILIRGLAKLGKAIHTCNRGKLGTNFAELLIAMLDARTAGDERRQIIERTMRGRNGKARSGKVVGGGRTPYGYTFQDGEFAIIEVEAKVVRLIYRWYTIGDGNDEPLTGFAIARKLSEMSIPTPGEKLGQHRVRKPCMWDPDAVHRILSSEVYAGVWRYGKRIGYRGRGGKRSLADQIAVQVPAIVTRKLWESAQSQREYNRQMSRRNVKREYLLRGMVRCGFCDRAMVGSCDKKEFRYYRCISAAQGFTGLEDLGCAGKRVRADRVEAFAWQYVKGVMSDKDAFEKALRKEQASEHALLEPKREQLATVLEMIAESEAEATRLAKAVPHIKPGIVSKALQKQIDDVEARHAGQLKKRDELQAALQDHELTEENIQAALRFREDVLAGMQNPTLEDKRRVFEMLHLVVEVKGNQARAKCRIFAEEEPFDSRTSCSLSKPSTSNVWSM